MVLEEYSPYPGPEAVSFPLGCRTLGPAGPVYLVAEIGINHNGDPELARETIRAAARAGADAVKFQTFRAGEFMADRDVPYEYLSGGSLVRESMYEMFKRTELRPDQHPDLKNWAREAGVDFLSSAADPESADLLAGLGVPAIKLASEDLINYPLLRHVGGLDLPVILSTGMADRDEISLALETIRDAGQERLLLLHCVSLYPTPDREANLHRIRTLSRTFGLPVGYSDHTQGTEAALGAAALGALFIEKHFTLDRSLPGPDHAFSSDPTEFRELSAGVRRLRSMLGDGDLTPGRAELEAARNFRRGIVAGRDLPEGAVLGPGLLALKRPQTGLHPKHLPALTGRVLRTGVPKDGPIDWDVLL